MKTQAHDPAPDVRPAVDVGCNSDWIASDVKPLTQDTRKILVQT